ncbi:hypothetical protein P3875_05740 [Myroides sp. JBRI-B21084]|uniref:hypothetical protein n=1 Tax=Myroides sp. JBRI-B21084 TaxID=3119977 RepID=UPI0026E3F207|nr:hypothetical protein [Paenimyroides cloacae]WKW47555.1 hypothetical protein P3875_05740 [Paenimyroides cloacae]
MKNSKYKNTSTEDLVRKKNTLKYVLIGLVIVDFLACAFFAYLFVYEELRMDSKNYIPIIFLQTVSVFLIIVNLNNLSTEIENRKEICF